MNRIVYFLLGLLTVLVSACADKETEVPNMRFERRIYALTNQPVEVTLYVAHKPEQAKTLDVVFDGTAVKGQDYSVSSEQYVVGGNAEKLTITITPLHAANEQKNIVMRLKSDPSVTTVLDMTPRPDLLYSFQNGKEEVGATADVSLELFSSETGSRYYVEEDTPIELEVDPSSTAQEGTDFEFVNKKDTVKIGKNTANFKIKVLQRDAHRNVIILRPKLSEADRYYAGRYPKTQLNIITSYAYDVEGEWVMNKFICDKKYIKNMYDGMIPDAEFENIPEFNKNDTFTFTRLAAGKYQLTTSLESNLKYYFQPSAVGVFDGEFTIRAMRSRTKLQIMKVKDVNRFFSATKQSTDREGYVGLRNYVDPDTHELLLDVYVFDYEPTDFLQSLNDYGMVGTTKPKMTDNGNYLRFTLKKKH